MGSLESLKGEHVHTRSIRIETFSAGDGRIIIEGRLDDARHVVTHSLAGGRLQPGPMHDMVVRFLVGETPPRILDTEVDLNRVPMEECEQVGDSIKKLAGFPIVYGYSKAVKECMGGTKGCTHLTALALAMGAAAMQGYAGNRTRESMPPQAKAIMVQYVKGSCFVWREDGKIFKRLMEEIEKDNL